MRSVLQDWVMELPLRHQGTLLTCVRSCDLAPKLPSCINERYGCSTGEGSAERQLTAWLRWVIMNPADARETDIAGAFFQSRLPRSSSWKPSQFGHYPLHWFSHLMHSFEIIGYKHPDKQIRAEAYSVYSRLAHSLHLPTETESDMDVRLLEDRFVAGTVVS